VIAFTHDRAGNVDLHVADVGGIGHDIVQPIPAREWRAVLRAVDAYYARSLVPRERLPAASAIQRICVTIDGDHELLEMSHDGHVDRVRSYDIVDRQTCYTPFDKLEKTLIRSVVRLLPYCGKLERRGDLQRIEDCMLLSGDKMLAAEVFNRSYVFDNASCRPAAKADNYAAVMAPDAALTVAGRAPVGGAFPAAQAFAAYLCETDGTITFADVSASGNSATVSGTLIKSREEESGQERFYYATLAPFTQHWTRGADGVFRMMQWTIEAFGPEAQYYPN
jgi:ketosteroid isomerase-like protein